MAPRAFFQDLADLASDFFAFTADVLGRDLTRGAIIYDLGGDPAKATTVNELPATNLAAIKAYRDAASPTLEANVQVVRDIATVLDVLIGDIELWSEAFELDDGGEAAVRVSEELTLGLLELVGSAWVRFRWPRVYLGLEALAVVSDTTSTYGPGANEYERMWTGLKALLGFLLQPGKTLAALEPGRPLEKRQGQLLLDANLRLFAAVVGFVDIKGSEDFEGIGFLHDTYSGWDAPALSIDSTEEPTAADLIASHMVSFSLGREEVEEELSSIEQLLVTLMFVAQEDGTPAFLMALGGSLSIDERLSRRWVLSGRLRGDAGIAAILGGGMTDLAPGFGDAVQRVGLASVPDELTAISFSIPQPERSRVDIGQVAIEFELGATGVSLTLSLANAVLVLDGRDVDGFVKRLWPDDPVRLPFNLTLGYGSERGLIVEGSVVPLAGAGPGARNSPLGGNRNADAPVISATIPLGKRLGPVTVHEVAITISRGTADAPDEEDVYSVAADVSFSAQLGPVYFRLDRVGLGTVVDWARPRSERNLEFIDARFGMNPPLGIAVHVDDDLVSGGGVLFHDPVAGTYAGALALRLKDKFTLKAIGLVATRRPDGTEGSSFIVIATLEGKLLQIGPFTLQGLGLLLASDRTFDEDAVRAALPTGQLRTVLFPPDPVHQFTAVQRSLDTFFPAQPDSYLVGLLVAMSFGSDRLIRLDLALVYQGGESVSNRLVVLGRVSSLLPDETAPVVRINLDAVGIFDPSAGVAALDAVLVDSKLVGRFALTGSAAFRRTPGSGGFALSVGGFHPAFRPPDGFPALRRITLALTSGDNPKLICEAYLAITSNTLQIGASATLYASACGFSIDGNIGFDALIEPLDFSYLAEFRASVQLKRGSRNLFKVSVSGALEGSLPLRVRGKASFEICWCEFSVGFDRRLLGGSSDRRLPAVDALQALLQQLGEPAHWASELPRAAVSMVTVRTEDRVNGQILLHPMGRLTVRQGAVPLNLGRDIDRIGAASPSGDRRFAITRVTVGSNEQVVAPVLDLFAPAQYFDLTDDEKLAAPSFEEMDAGLAFGDADYRLVDGQRESSPFDYTDIVIGADGSPTVEEEPHHADGAWVIRMLGFGAAAQSRTRRSPSERFAGGPREQLPGLRRRGWAVAEAGSTAPAVVAGTWAEAKSLADVPTATGARVLVPTTRLGEG